MGENDYADLGFWLKALAATAFVVIGLKLLGVY